MDASIAELMNWVDRRISERLLQFRSGQGGGPTTPPVSDPAVAHHLLSPTHTDTIADAVQRGDLLAGMNATPAWKRLAKGAAKSFLTGDGSDVLWSTGLLDIAAGKTLAIPNSLTLAGAEDDYTLTIPGTGTAVLTSRAVVAGSGLMGGGDLSADLTLSVGAGTLIDVSANAVGIANGSNYQFIGTGPGATAAWQNLSSLAGAGLAHNAGALSIIAGLGIDVTEDGVGVDEDYAFAWTASHSWSQNLFSPGFASGWTGNGWRIDNGVSVPNQTTAEFDNLIVRNRLRVYEMLVNQLRSTNGSVLVSNTGKIASDAVSTTADETWENGDGKIWEDGSRAQLEQSYIVTEDVHGFVEGDLIRAKRFSGSQGTFQSDLVVASVPTPTSFSYSIVGGTAPPQAGYEYVRLGNLSDSTRQGGVFLTPDETGAPYIDVFDGVDSHAAFGTMATLRARLGRLSGVTDPVFGTLSGYGLWTSRGYFGSSSVSMGDDGLAIVPDADAFLFRQNGDAEPIGKVTAHRDTSIPANDYFRMERVRHDGGSATPTYIQLNDNGVDVGPQITVNGAPVSNNSWLYTFYHFH